MASQPESLAFWISFIGTIVSIVLSLVAIVFSVLVDRRSTTVSDRTIQSLQKIESAVERSSSDTRELIKAGWDRMLGNVGKEPSRETSDASAKEVAGGIAAELRTELMKIAADVGVSEGASKAKFQEIENYLKNLEATLSAQLRTARTEQRPSARIDSIISTLRELSPRSYALVAAINGKHLSQDQYQKLSRGRLMRPLLELREEGLLVPAVHKTNHGPEPCYYFPSSTARTVSSALEISGEPNSDAFAEVLAELKSVGYDRN
jgi:hypothetical protein